jgi:hypothetical protein
VLTATVLGLAIWRGIHRRDESLPQRRQIATLLSVLGFTYLMLPYEITKPMAWWYVSPRVPSMMAPLLALLPVAMLRGWTRLVMAPVIVCAIVLPLKLTRLYADFSRRNEPCMHLIERTPLGSNVLVVVRGMMRGKGSEELSGDPATSGPVYWHFSSWPMALHGGYGPYVFDQGIPIVPRLKLKAPAWTSTDSFVARQAPDFDYYIVRSPSSEIERDPSLKVTTREGEWVLFQRVRRVLDEP